MVVGGELWRPSAVGALRSGRQRPYGNLESGYPPPKAAFPGSQVGRRLTGPDGAGFHGVASLLAVDLGVRGGRSYATGVPELSTREP